MKITRVGNTLQFINGDDIYSVLPLKDMTLFSEMKGSNPYVKLFSTGGINEILVMQVENQPTWTANAQGLQNCLDDLNEWIAAAGVTPAPTNPKVYRALLSQSDTDSPTATVLENTIGEITFIYNNIGEYLIKSLELFSTRQKCFYKLNNPSYDSIANATYTDESTINLITAGLDANPNNGILYYTPIEILVYE